MRLQAERPFILKTRRKNRERNAITMNRCAKQRFFICPNLYNERTRNARPCNGNLCKFSDLLLYCSFFEAEGLTIRRKLYILFMNS